MHTINDLPMGGCSTAVKHFAHLDSGSRVCENGTGSGVCKHCGRSIVWIGSWIDPGAMGDDSIWRETCDSHDTFTAEHEPADNGTCIGRHHWDACGLNPDAVRSNSNNPTERG